MVGRYHRTIFPDFLFLVGCGLFLVGLLLVGLLLVGCRCGLFLVVNNGSLLDEAFLGVGPCFLLLALFFGHIDHMLWSLHKPCPLMVGTKYLRKQWRGVILVVDNVPMIFF